MVKENTEPGQVRSYDVIRDTAFDRLFNDIVFSGTSFVPIDSSGDNMHDLLSASVSRRPVFRRYLLNGRVDETKLGHKGFSRRPNNN